MKLSICMMVKNESHNLDRCLQSLQPVLQAVKSELIIVDTGSEDNTLEIAQKYTDKVYFHPWNNDFSAMRNITIHYASGEWILIFDADEVLDEYQEIIDFLKSPDRMRYAAAAITGKNITNENNLNEFSTLATLRVFRRTKEFRYDGAVHNQPVINGPIKTLQASLLHYGYMSTDKALMERKFLRTSAILQSELEKNPDNVYYLYQLSVSYGMYKDYKEAIRYIEKAYEIYQRLKPSDSMYLFTYSAMLYQITGNYQKVEEICLESLSIKEGYLDIYYFLAEAQAVGEKFESAIENYNKYLKLCETYTTDSDKDPSVIDYTFANQENAWYNLSNLYNQVGIGGMALRCAEKVTNPQFIKDNILMIVSLYIQAKKYDELRSYRDIAIKNDLVEIFYEKIEKAKQKFDCTATQQVASVFADIDDSYGLLSRIILEDAKGELSEATLESMQEIDFSVIPLYCSQFVYYMLKWKYPLEQKLTQFKEIWITCLLENVAKERDDLSSKIYEFLEQYNKVETISEYKLSKALCRFTLLLDKLNEQEYKIIFDRYVRHGIAYLQLLYNENVLEDTLVYEVKNDEEVFLIYMYQAYQNEESNEAEYVRYLREALQALPILKKGIEILLSELQVEKQAEKNEFDSYKEQVKATIKQLIENGKWADAQLIINEYKSVVPNDMEIVLFESELSLRLVNNEKIS